MSDNADKIKEVESYMIDLYDQNSNDFLIMDDNNNVTLNVTNKIIGENQFDYLNHITVGVDTLVLLNQTRVSFTGTKTINKIIVCWMVDGEMIQKEFTNYVLRVRQLYIYFGDLVNSNLVPDNTATNFLRSGGDIKFDITKKDLDVAGITISSAYSNALIQNISLSSGSHIRLNILIKGTIPTWLILMRLNSNWYLDRLGYVTKNEEEIFYSVASINKVPYLSSTISLGLETTNNESSLDLSSILDTSFNPSESFFSNNIIIDEQFEGNEPDFYYYQGTEKLPSNYTYSNLLPKWKLIQPKIKSVTPGSTLVVVYKYYEQHNDENTIFENVKTVESDSYRTYLCINIDITSFGNINLDSLNNVEVYIDEYIYFGNNKVHLTPFGYANIYYSNNYFLATKNRKTVSVKMINTCKIVPVPDENNLIKPLKYNNVFKIYSTSAYIYLKSCETDWNIDTCYCTNVKLYRGYRTVNNLYINVIVSGTFERSFQDAILPLPRSFRHSNGKVNETENGEPMAVNTINELPLDTLKIASESEEDKSYIEFTNIVGISGFRKLCNTGFSSFPIVFHATNVTILERFKNEINIDGILTYFKGNTLVESEREYAKDYGVMLKNEAQVTVSRTVANITFDKCKQIGDEKESFPLGKYIDDDNNLHIDIMLIKPYTVLTDVNIIINELVYITRECNINLYLSVNKIYQDYDKNDGYFDQREIVLGDKRINKVILILGDSSVIEPLVSEEVFENENQIKLVNYCSAQCKVGEVYSTNILRDENLEVSRFTLNLMIKGEIPLWLYKVLPLPKYLEQQDETVIFCDQTESTMELESVNAIPTTDITINNTEPDNQCTFNLDKIDLETGEPLENN